MGEGKMGWEERKGRGKDRVEGGRERQGGRRAGGEGGGWVEEGMGQSNQYGRLLTNWHDCVTCSIFKKSGLKVV